MKVSILMGSSSDKDVVIEAEKILSSFGISFDSKVLSAHRSPDLVVNHVQKATKEGTFVFICAAGMAAHLAGVCAAHTIRPVIGIPLSSGGMGGLDSLLSTVQMPKGVPVATVAVGKSGARNAALLAIQILGVADKKLEKAFLDFKKQMLRDVEEQNL